MRTVCKIIVAALALIAFAIADSAGAQEMKEKTVKEQIVGTWWVVSAVNEMGGKKSESFGSAPKGQFIFTADGHFSTNIRFGNRMTGTPEENKEAVAGNISNFGSYAINSDGSITLEIIGSSFPNRDGTKQKRLAEIKGDEKKWTNPAASMGGTSVIMLQRAKSGSPPLDFFWLVIQAVHEVGDPWRQRLLQNLAIYLPKMIADAQSKGTGNTRFCITSSYCPFRKRLSLLQNRSPHGTIPVSMMPCPANPIMKGSKWFP